jgi:hypothetical protein
MSTETETVLADVAPGQNSAPEQEVAEAAQPQTDAAEQGDQSPDDGEKLTDEQKTIRKLQRRIDRLTAGRGAAQREAELVREELARIQGRPQEQDEERSQRDIDRITAEGRDIDRIVTEKAKVLAQQQAIATRAAAVMDSGKKYAGFNEAVNAVADEVPFTVRGGGPSPFIEAVMDNKPEKAAEVLNWLGNNPDEAAQFNGLSPAQIGRRLAKLEDRLEREAKGKTSSAPQPLTPVTAKAVGDKDPKTMTDAEFAAWRKAQISKRGS